MSKPRRAMVGGDEPVVEAHAPRRAMSASTAPAFASNRPKIGWWRRSLAPVAVMATMTSIVGFGVANQSAHADSETVVATTTTDVIDAQAISRSVVREGLDTETDPTSEPTPEVELPPSQEPTPEPVGDAELLYPQLGEVSGTKYAKSAGVNVRSEPHTDAKVVDTLEIGDKVKVTDEKLDGWQQISLDGEAAWVSAEFLQSKKPTDVVTASGDYSTAACASGSSIESGITENTKRAFRAFCAVFPQITSYGGYRAAESWSYHTRGAAIDAMVSDQDLGWTMAKWAAANADALNIDQVFFAQHVWTKENPTWRAVADQGNATANHYDHVHISVGG